MASKQKKPSIQPRATKASMLRLQKQQGSASGLVTASQPEEKSEIPESPRPATKSRVAKDTVGPTAGVKAFMAQQRARLAQPTSQKQASEKEPIRKSSNVMTGAQRYGGGSNSSSKGEPTVVETRKIQTVLKQAKASGKLDISSRGLTSIPQEVLNMYHVDPNSIVVDFTSAGDAWYDSVELTKFIAGDNAITEIDARLADEFGALKLLDFRDNKLSGLPESLCQLKNLTSIMMTYNSFEEIPSVLYQLPQLKELNLSHNQIKGNISMPHTTIEQLDLSYNDIGSLDIQDGASTIVKLNLNNNQIEQLPSALHWPKLKELLVNQNRLRTLFPGMLTVFSYAISKKIDMLHCTVTNEKILFPSLVRLDAGNNLIAMFDNQVSMPKLVELSLMTNKLQEDGLTGLSGAPNIQTLDISSNQLQNVPMLITNLTQLQRLDIRGNQLHALPYELGKLEYLKTIHCEGNPMRSFTSMSQTQLIESLKSNYRQQQQGEKEQSKESDANLDGAAVDQDGDMTNLSSNFTQKVSLTKRLDLSSNQLTELSAESMTFTDDIPGAIILHHNMFTAFPGNLNMIAGFIVSLNLEHNRLTSFNLTMAGVEFTHLKLLSLSNNRLKALECTEGLASSFPKLEELKMDNNALTSLPENLPTVLPLLKLLSVSSNKLDNITEASFGQTLEILILSNNDIGYLPPGLSTLENLKELVVFGNRFRVPRPAVVEQGTGAILEFLKRRHNAV
ncbi:leucine-rich repeat-containing protein 40-like [Mucor ambiguus]|uniref:Leucine-rich repeat-containing protein 40-like n=1 Tax=Mucor ambiguus TaxID=91626 RepID=A0A0C9MQF9_9FUNG|nr:leucine-rich repeat-containing protein 40-like [Mucor ambiguus]